MPSTELLRAILGATADALLAVDAHGAIVFVNDDERVGRGPQDRPEELGGRHVDLPPSSDDPRRGRR